MKIWPAILPGLVWASCIGTDEVVDPIVGAKVLLAPSQLALLIGESDTLEAAYFDQYGIERNFNLNYSSANTAVATVTNGGVVTAVGSGQTTVIATYESTASAPLLLTVVSDTDAVAQVVLTAPQGVLLEPGSSAPLQIAVLNVNGQSLTPQTLTFTSTQPAVASINAQGVISALSQGSTMVYANADGVQSNVLQITVGNTSRSGIFQDSGGYETNGSATLAIDENGSLVLTLSSDFSTDFALGTYVYLSNSISGQVTASSGLELTEITQGGSHTFDVSALAPGTSLYDYSYVIILCKPASLTFGYALLE